MESLVKDKTYMIWSETSVLTIDVEFDQSQPSQQSKY